MLNLNPILWVKVYAKIKHLSFDLLPNIFGISYFVTKKANSLLQIILYSRIAYLRLSVTGEALSQE